MWNRVRLASYITIALSGIAAVASQLGWVDYNPATQMVQFPPISIIAVAAVLANIPMAIMAAVAMVKRWGPSK